MDNLDKYGWRCIDTTFFLHGCEIPPKIWHVAPSHPTTRIIPLPMHGITHSTRGDAVRQTIHLFRIFHTRHLLPGGRGGIVQLSQPTHTRIRGRLHLEYTFGQRFSFPGHFYLEHSLNLSSPFLHRVKKVTPIMLLTKSLELSLIFNARRAWWDTLKSSQVVWRIPRTENHKLRWQPPPKHPFDNRHLASEGSWLFRYPMSRNHVYGTR